MPDRSGPVISNTGPLSSLALLDLVRILPRLYGEILIPAIRAVALARPASARLLMELHGSEAEVIALAEELGAALVIIDEALGREYATALGLPDTGTVGVLLRARREGLVQSITPLLEQLRDAGYRISDRLVAFARKEAGESP